MKLLLSMVLLFLTASTYPSDGSAGFGDVDHPAVLTPADKVELLWGEYLAAELDPVRFFALIEGLEPKNLDLRDQIRLTQMRNAFLGNVKSGRSIEKLGFQTALRLVSEESDYTNLELSLGKQALGELEKARRRLKELSAFRSKTRDEIVDLVFESPDLTDYQNGEYGGGVKLFLFCRHDRNYPCRFVMKDMYDRLVREKDGSLWSLPALAQSARGLPYYKTNGYTPSGVHSMDSVMPEANRQRAFGKFRRVILNWIPTDERTVELLPESAKSKVWWKAASLARNNGRKWLRIHGTGRTNTNPSATYFPHMPTAGCVSVREGKYGDVAYKDQRVILDSLMRAMQLAPVYSNEIRIKGMLYVVELDDKKKKVAEATLKEYGIH